MWAGAGKIKKWSLTRLNVGDENMATEAWISLNSEALLRDLAGAIKWETTETPYIWQRIQNQQRRLWTHWFPGPVPKHVVAIGLGTGPESCVFKQLLTRDSAVATKVGDPWITLCNSLGWTGEEEGPLSRGKPCGYLSVRIEVLWESSRKWQESAQWDFTSNSFDK